MVIYYTHERVIFSFYVVVRELVPTCKKRGRNPFWSRWTPVNKCHLVSSLAVMSCHLSLHCHAGQYHVSKLNISVLMSENHNTSRKQGQPACLCVFRKGKLKRKCLEENIPVFFLILPLKFKFSYEVRNLEVIRLCN